MARKKNASLSAFDNVLNGLGYSNSERAKEAIDADKILVGNEVDDIDSLEQNNVVPANIPDGEAEDTDKGDAFVHEDDTEIPENVLNNTSLEDQEDEETNDDDNHDGDGETEDDNNETVNSGYATVGDFFDAFAEAQGWSVTDEEKPQTVEDLINYIGDVVEENSTPDFADPRVQQLNDYIKNGGNFEDFYNGASKDIVYEQMDLENENNQKMVVHDYLSAIGYSEDEIDSKIERYEDAGMLEEEATDAHTRLVNYQQQQLAQQQAQQQAYAEQVRQQQAQFANDLAVGISNLTNVKGINVPASDRRLLLDYITSTDADGRTQYQKDYESNAVQNLIETAYFMMKGDSLLGEAARNGQTTATNKLRKLMQHQTKNHTHAAATEKQRSVVDLASRWF